jgi:nickel transport system ATP-binding protein
MLVGLETPQGGDTGAENRSAGSRAKQKAFRRDIQLVFQDAISAVNPRKTVREIFASRCAICCRLTKAERWRVEAMLQAVDLDDSVLDKRPRSSAADSCSASAWRARWRLAAAADP